MDRNVIWRTYNLYKTNAEEYFIVFSTVASTSNTSDQNKFQKGTNSYFHKTHFVWNKLSRRCVESISTALAVIQITVETARRITRVGSVSTKVLYM